MTTTRDDWRALAVVVLVVAVAGVGGYLLGVRNTEQADWHTAVATVMGTPRDPQVALRADGWSYGIDGGEVEWIDEYGTHNSGTWPECLEPYPLASDKGHKRVTIRFAAVEVRAEDSGWRPVVMVDCRPAVGNGWTP